MINQSVQLDLGGEWQLVLDPANEGFSAGWTAGKFPEHQAAAVAVPSLWNLTYPDYEGIAFYRKVFRIPDAWAGDVVLIQFQGVSYRTEAWLNGIFLGSHEGAYTPFWFDLTRDLHNGEDNELILRVAGLSKTMPVDGVLLKHAPASKQSWYYTHGGPWGKVWLERRPQVYIQELVLEPYLRRENVQIVAALNNCLQTVHEVQLNIKITDPTGIQVANFSTGLFTMPGLNRHAFLLPIYRPMQWNTNTPHLYRAEVEVVSQAGTDTVENNFGMRDFTVDNGQYFLNGEPVFLKMILLQPHYPVTHVVPPDEDMMRKEITLIKEAGFNMIRCHIRPSPPGYLDIADQLGIMIYAETSLAWIRENPRMLEHGEREIRDLIERDRNHASVVMWGIFNENPPASVVYSDRLLRYARVLDPTRVVLDNSGGSMAFDQDFGWLDRAYVLPDRESCKQKILDIHTYLGNYIPGAVYEWVRGLGSGAPFDALPENDYCTPAVVEEFERECRSYSGKISFSELGGGGLLDLDSVLSQFGERLDLIDARELSVFRDSFTNGFHKRHLDRIFGSLNNLVSASQELHAGGVVRQLEAVLCNPRASGYGLTQLNDVAWELQAGILDMWRNPKPVYHAVKRLNQPVCVVLKAASPVVTCGEQVPVNISLVQRSAVRAFGQLIVEVNGPGSKTKSCIREVPPGTAEVSEFNPILVDVDQPGSYTLAVQLISAGELLASSTETFLALPSISLAESLQKVAWITSLSGLEKNEEDILIIYPESKEQEDTDKKILVAPEPSKLSYPQWEVLLNEANGGREVVIGPLHRNDRLALEALQDRGIEVQLDLGIGSWVGCHHWTSHSPLFDGLPGGGLAGEAYIDLLPQYSMSEKGGEILSGAIRSRHSVEGASEFLWYSDIEIIPFGQGKLIFCQYRMFYKLGSHPVARRLFHNLVHLLSAESTI